MLRKQAVFEYAATRQRLRCFGNVRFGSKADICVAKANVRFTPNSDRESRHLPKVMSALPLKADMCAALAHVCFGPKADSCSAANAPSFRHLVSEREQRRGEHSEAPMVP